MRAPRALREITLYQFYELVMIDISRRNNDEILDTKHLAVILSRRDVIERANGFRCPCDRQPERMTRKVSSAEYLAEAVLGRIVGHLQLFDYHSLLALHLLLVEDCVSEHVRHQVESWFEFVVDDFDGESRFLMRREGLKRPAKAILFDRDIECGTTLRAFENRVLDKMRDAVEFVGLVPRPGAKKEPQCDRAHAGHSISENDETVFKTGFTNVFFHERKEKVSTKSSPPCLGGVAAASADGVVVRKESDSCLTTTPPRKASAPS